jgi:hypothetical protein
MVIVIVTVEKSILLLGNTEIRSVSVGLPMSEGTVEFQIFPVDRKDSFSLKLFAEDGEMAWSVGSTDTAVILWAILVMVPRIMTVTTDKVVVRISGYDGDVGR